MKKLLTTIISLMFFGNLVFAQLTEFSMGDILSAGAMNQNFKYLEKRFGGLNETTVDCGTTGSGSGINAAIKNGYNSIVIKGICKENIARKAKKGKRGILKLRGFSNNQASDKIVDNSSNTESVILMGSLTFLKIDNLTISGGTRGINVVGNSFLRADNITVEKYTERGINVNSSSAAWLGSVTVDGTQQSSSDERGIYVEDESLGWIYGTTTVNGNSGSNGGIGASDSTIWLTGTINLDSNKQSLVIQSGGNMGFYDSTTTITNSTSYGIKAYYGKIWNYGTMTISNNSEGNYAVLIDRSEAYLANMTISGGTGTNNLVNVWQGQLTLEDSTIKDHQGNLFYAGGGSTLQFDGTNSFSNKDSSSSRCVVNFDDTDFKFDGSTTINGTNTTGCSAFGFKRSRGQIKNITVTGPEEALYAQTSDVEIRGGTFSSTGKKAVTVLEGSRFKIYSNDNDISITSSADDALDVKSSYLNLKKGSSKNLTISSTASGESAINIRERSTVDITGNTNTYANVEVNLGSYLHIDEDVTITTLSCTNSSKIHKEGTVTNTSACANTNYISD